MLYSLSFHNDWIIFVQKLECNGVLYKTEFRLIELGVRV